MYDIEILSRFNKFPVFSLSDVNQVIDNRDYAKKFLGRMVKNGKVFKIKRNVYTLHKDPFLISAFLVKPSYISGMSALYYHRLVTQIPNRVFCATSKSPARINFAGNINFFHTNYFFGFKYEEYEDFKIPIADPEKAIIDSIGKVPISVFEEALDSIDEEMMINYLKRIKKSSIVKRIGYLMEKQDYDAHKSLKRFINYKYILLDPLSKKNGEKDKKWGVIINIK
ncbi:hypothetical protein HYT56_03960 [Candidatus Woesearchaeota archaeon]|nr:hypothetical protein [Candidatus Woesearchaeota archaeon]